MTERDWISDLVGRAYPSIIELPTGRLRREWLLRVATPVTTARLGQLAREICKSLEEELPPCGAVELVRLAPRHVVARTDFPASGRWAGVAALGYQWGALRRIDAALGIRDLQGIPSERWGPLRLGRDGTRR